MSTGNHRNDLPNNYQRMLGLGLVPDLAPVFAEIIRDSLRIETVTFLKNIEMPDHSPFGGVPGMQITEETCLDGNFGKRIGDSFFFGVVNPGVKQQVFKQFKNQAGIQQDQFPVIIHPSAMVACTAITGLGLMAEQGVIIGACTEVAFGVNLKRGVNIGHHVLIGSYSTINPGVVLSGRVQIGAGVMIGTGALVIDGVKIGANSLIGAGSVVTRDIPDGVVAYGNPCKIIREQDKWKLDNA